MLGGGTFVTQNKTLPGSYINFVSASNAGALMGDRGYVAIAMPLKWGKDGEIFTVTSEDFRKNCLKIFGFKYDSDEAKGLRELFKNAKVAYCYKLMKNGAKASNSIAQALYKGSKGTQISTRIVAGTASGTFDVDIWFGTDVVFSETVSTLEELLADNNGWVEWTLESLEASTKTAMSGTGLDGDTITSTEHSAFLDASEEYSFNAMACLSSDSVTQGLYIQECKDMREDAGIKYQLVVYNKAADYEGVVNVKNSVMDDGADAFALVYWVTGVIAGCAVNASNTNKVYDGEFAINTSYTKAQLESAIKSGEFTFHKVGTKVRVLTDINSLTTTTENKGNDFKSNQTIRVLDQIAMDIASLFNNYYLGTMQNDASGRISLWNEIVRHHQNLETIRAIENFKPEDVTVEQGESKRAVVVNDVVMVVNAMEQLYMTVVVQ